MQIFDLELFLYVQGVGANIKLLSAGCATTTLITYLCRFVLGYLI